MVRVKVREICMGVPRGKLGFLIMENSIPPPKSRPGTDSLIWWGVEIFQVLHSCIFTLFNIPVPV